MNETILTRFENQRSRGTTSFGYYLPTTDRLTHNVKESRIKALLQKTDNDEVLFHHRYSTSTIDVRNACHPFSTKKYFEYQYIGVHNGVLKNEKELRKEHAKIGIEYVSVQENDTFNDSESLIYDLAQYLEGQIDKPRSKGRIAFVLIKRDLNGKPLTLFFAHNTGSPLVMKKTQFSLTVSSTGEGDAVPVNMLHQWDYETKELRTSPISLDLGYSTYTAPGTYTVPRGGSSTAVAPKSISSDKVYTTWDDFANDFQNGLYNKEQQEQLLELKKDMDKDFNMRAGDMIDVHQAILSENKDSYASAALVTILEAEEATVEMSLIGNWIGRVEKDDKETMKTLVAYLQEVTTYRNMLMKVADEFNSKSRIVKDVLSSAKEDETIKVFGFHPNPKSPADRRISPSAVLANNNKSLDGESKE